MGTCVTSTGTWWLPKDERASERSRDKKALSVLLHPAKESKHARLSLQKLGGLGPLRKQLPSHHFPAPFQQSGKEIQPNSSPHQARGWEKYGQSLPPGGAFICLFSEVAVISNSPPFLVELLALASLPAGKARPPLFFFWGPCFSLWTGPHYPFFLVNPHWPYTSPTTPFTPVSTGLVADRPAEPTQPSNPISSQIPSLTQAFSHCTAASASASR